MMQSVSMKDNFLKIQLKQQNNLPIEELLLLSQLWIAHSNANPSAILSILFHWQKRFINLPLFVSIVQNQQPLHQELWNRNRLSQLVAHNLINQFVDNVSIIHHFKIVKFHQQKLLNPSQKKPTQIKLMISCKSHNLQQHESNDSTIFLCYIISFSNFNFLMNKSYSLFVKFPKIYENQLLVRKIKKKFIRNFIAIDKLRMLQHIKKLFLAIIVITCFTCFQRADYNLPLFAFAYFLWEYKHPISQKPRLFYLFIATWLVDFIWVVYWGATWSSDEYQNSGASGSSTFVLSLSIIAFIIKLAVIVVLYIFDSECKLAIKNFGSNFKSVFAENGQQVSVV